MKRIIDKDLAEYRVNALLTRRKMLMERMNNLTKNMQRLYFDVISSLGQMTVEKRIYLFGDEENPDMEWVCLVANYIVLEFVKYSWDKEDPVYPLRHFLVKNDADDSDRMLQSRIMQYVIHYKRLELEEAGLGHLSSHKYANVEMKTMAQKLQGYRITEMNYFEHQNIHDLEIIKAIVEKRIVSAKKISNKRFIEMFEQYDRFIEHLIERSRKSDEDMIFASLALFTLEWHYPIEMLYLVACQMENTRLYELDQSTLGLLCGNVKIESQFGGTVQTESRMVKERLFFLQYLFFAETDSFRKQALVDLIKEIIVEVTNYKEILKTNDGEQYKEWFRRESSTRDRASFLRYYDVFSIWRKKEFTRTRIQNMRKLFKMVLK